MSAYSFQEIEVVTLTGMPTGCFRWAAVIDMCDHEHDQGDPICEDARVAIGNLRAKEPS
jgi:hypothetical protein